MEFNQIRYFLVLSETLNFTMAAEKCSVSQSALSKAIQKLEDTLGAELVDRTQQQVKLTPFGRTMKVHLERIEQNRRLAMDAALATRKSQKIVLNVGLMCTVGPHGINSFLKEFRMEYPDAEIVLHDVVPSVIPELLLSGSLDCVFCARDVSHDKRFHAIELFKEDMMICFSDDHHFQNLNSISLEDIASQPYLDRLQCEFRDEFMDLVRTSGLELNVSVSSEREDWIISLLRCNLGVSILPAGLALLNNLSNRPIKGLTRSRTVELVTTVTRSELPSILEFQKLAAKHVWE